MTITKTQVERAFVDIELRAKTFGITKFTVETENGKRFNQDFYKMVLAMVDTFRAVSDNFVQVCYYIEEVEQRRYGF